VHLIHPLNLEVSATGVYRQCQRCPNAFSSVFNSLLTFAQTVVAGDSWGMVAVPIIEMYPYAGLFFASVFVSVSLGMVNLILAVIYEGAHGSKTAIREEERVKQEREYINAASELLRQCKQLDRNGNGHLKKEELMEGYQNDNFANTMKVMGLMQEDLDVLCDILFDHDNGGIKLE